MGNTKATITNKTRPAGSFSSSYSQAAAGRLAGPVFYVYVFSLLTLLSAELSNRISGRFYAISFIFTFNLKIIG
jgi:hypothetical protein